ncbi:MULTISPECIES: terpene synthase family protein [Streptomyces]|uniref:terpene synthase family protein n=1 Tax=Streptomyces TaxID=1883 RepID=UPI00163CEBDC|nr:MULTISPECIES: hypothetical protein [Streptomyces]MBC2878041.1 hypothetical protein [Streptomyces sp. TYQ1024]UBI39995.1 hypothetical protein K7I03_28365 [Streptomyces mobaraensis]UKW32576.1 hypothetical protein MCU78_28295 [Streptomyces sp. TYQ1024]
MQKVQPVVELPPFYCPIQGAIHPHTDHLRRRSEEWMHGYGFCPDAASLQFVRSFNSADFVGRMAPHGLLDPMQVLTDWCNLGFVIDERFDRIPLARSDRNVLAEAAELAVKLVRTFETPGAGLLTTSPFGAPLEDLATRMHRMTTPSQRRRIVEGTHLWASALVWEVADHARPEPPSLNDYTTQRQQTIGGALFTSWIDTLTGVEVPASEMDHPSVRALTEITGLIVGIDNDLFSYANDLWFHQNQGVTLRNFATVLAAEGGCTTDQALREVTWMRNRLTALFLALRDQLTERHRPRAGSALRNYMRHLGYLIRGNLDYYGVTDKYRNPDGRSPDTLLRVAYRFTSKPPDNASEPLPIPTISWWWDQLATA